MLTINTRNRSTESINDVSPVTIISPKIIMHNAYTYINWITTFYQPNVFSYIWYIYLLLSVSSIFIQINVRENRKVNQHMWRCYTSISLLIFCTYVTYLVMFNFDQLENLIYIYIYYTCICCSCFSVVDNLQI